jgi:dTDP-4-dehydrorhamnose 3,5-epimerase
MIFREASVAGVFVIDLEPRTDERGFFARCFCEHELAAHGLPTRFPQCNISRNKRRGTLRGMHFQADPAPEAKLVRCVTGAVYDVVVDLREGSPTRLHWIGVDLSADDARAVFVPAGMAHGFITLVGDSDVFYHMSDFFRPEAARGFRWDDPSFAIQWPLPPRVISPRDASFPDFDATHPEGR